MGLGVGSFLNVVIDRSVSGKDLGGRSSCDFCNKKIYWYDLIPVLSYFFLLGKCRFCNKKLSIQYPLIEILTGVLYMFVYIVFFQAQLFHMISMLIIITVSIIIAVTDLKYQIIPDWAITTLFLIGILGSSNSLFYYFAGSLVGVFFLWIIHHLSNGTAMGYGDVKLIAAEGIVLSLPFLLISLYSAFLFGGIFALFLLLMRKKKMSSQMAFGPFLIIGFLISMFMSYGK